MANTSLKMSIKPMTRVNRNMTTERGPMSATISFSTTPQMMLANTNLLIKICFSVAQL